MNNILRALVLGLLVAWLPLAGLARDLTFLLASDVHVGMAYKEANPPVSVADYSKHIKETMDAIATIPGKAWPKNVTTMAEVRLTKSEPSTPRKSRPRNRS